MNNSAWFLLSPFCLIAPAWCPWPFEVCPVPAVNFWGSPTPTEHLKTNSISELTDQARVKVLTCFLFCKSIGCPYMIHRWYLDQRYVGECTSVVEVGASALMIYVYWAETTEATHIAEISPQISPTFGSLNKLFLIIIIIIISSFCSTNV